MSEEGKRPAIVRSQASSELFRGGLSDQTNTFAALTYRPSSGPSFHHRTY